MPSMDDTRESCGELENLAAVKRKMGTERALFSHYPQRKCPVFTMTYRRQRGLHQDKEQIASHQPHRYGHPQLPSTL